MQASRPTNHVLLVGGHVLDIDADRLDRLDVEVSGDRIVDIREPTGRPPRTGTDVVVIDVSGRMVLPGFVNAHTHAHNNLLKGLEDCYWLEAHIQLMAREVLHWTPRDYYVSTALGAMEMALTGTTTVFDMVQLPPGRFAECLAAVVQAYLDVGLRASIAPTLADRTPGEHSNTSLDPSVLAELEDSMREWHRRSSDRIQLAVAPVVHRASEEFLAGCGELAHRRDLGIHYHFLESRRQAIRAAGNDDLLPRLRRYRLLNDRTLLAHAVWVDHEGREVIAESGASIAHNPASNLKLGSGVAPVRELLNLGVNVTLGTDGSASSDNQNMFQAMWLAALLSHVRGPDYRMWLSAHEVLRMASERGSTALGLGGDFGKLKVGQRADMLLLDLGSMYLVPLNSPVRQIVYSEVGTAIDRVFVGGREIVQNGRLLTVPERDLIAEAKGVAHRLRMRREAEGRGPLQPREFDELELELRLSERLPYPLNQYATSVRRDDP